VAFSEEGAGRRFQVAMLEPLMTATMSMSWDIMKETPMRKPTAIGVR
jgi:hypothetical protein